jgi:hypothetical protein
MAQQLDAAGGANNHELPPQLTANTRVPVHCGICFDDIVSATYKTIAGSPLCDECIRSEIVPLFEKALNHEFAFPVTWGFGTTLEATDFANELGADFVKRFQRIEKEYHTPPSKRVYCKSPVYAEHAPPRGEAVKRPFWEKEYLRKDDYIETMPKSEEEAKEAIKDGRRLVECGAMVCQWKKIPSYGPRSVFLLPRCWACNNDKVCSQCGNKMWSQWQFEKHRCPWKPQINAEKALEGMTRGKDYQICPNPRCKEAVALKDGCVSNPSHITTETYANN